MDEIGRQAQFGETLRRPGAVPGFVALGLLRIEVVGKSGEAPQVGILAEPRGQAAHHSLGRQHVASQVDVGHRVVDQAHDFVAGCRGDAHANNLLV